MAFHFPSNFNPLNPTFCTPPKKSKTPHKNSADTKDLRGEEGESNSFIFMSPNWTSPPPLEGREGGGEGGHVSEVTLGDDPN